MLFLLLANPNTGDRKGGFSIVRCEILRSRIDEFQETFVLR